MSKKQRWLWEIYFVIALYLAVEKIYFLYKPGSPDYIYYSILKSFDPIFCLAYWKHLLHLLLNLIHCIPLLLFIYRKKLLNPRVWQYLFIFRCIFELFDHSYQTETLAALFHTNPKLLILVLLYAIVPLIPSYIACYLYAFKFDILRK